MEQNERNPIDLHVDTKILRYIIAIVDQKSLSRAANELYLSQPALSRHLHNVEELLGTPIFLRRHNRLELTSAGKIFINGARSMLHIEQEMIKNLYATKQNWKTDVCVAAEGVFFDYLTDVISPTFTLQYPDITLVLTHASGEEIRRLVSDGSCDAGFYCGAETDSPFLSCEILFQTTLALYVSTDRARTVDPLSGLQDEAFLLSDDPFLQQLQRRMLLELGISQPRVACTASLPILLTLLQNGHGNLLLPPELLAAHCPPSQIIRSHTAPTFGGIFVATKRHAHSKPTMHLIETAKADLCQYPYVPK